MSEEKILSEAELAEMEPRAHRNGFPIKDIESLFESHRALAAKRDRLAEQQRWIPVSERLPEEVGYYLVAYGALRPDVGFYHPNRPLIDIETEETVGFSDCKWWSPPKMTWLDKVTH